MGRRERMKEVPNKLISIIVPVYNTEKYLAACLKSIKGQSYRDFEVIIVDNNSSDNSVRLIKKEIKGHKRFSLLSEKKAGQGNARNAGLRKAKGELICFVDSDDFIAKDYLKWLYQSMIESDSSLSTGVIGIFKGDGDSRKMEYEFSRSLKSDSTLTSVKNLLKGYDTGTCCNVLFKRSLLAGMSFNGNFFYEDLIFKLEVILKGGVDKVSFVAETGYFYRVNPMSTMKTFTKKHYDSVFFLLDRVKELLLEYKFYEPLRKEYEAFVLMISLARLYECYLYSVDRSLVKEFYRRLDKNIVSFRNIFALFFSGKITMIKFIVFLLIKVHPSVYSLGEFLFKSIPIAKIKTCTINKR